MKVSLLGLIRHKALGGLDQEPTCCDCGPTAGQTAVPPAGGNKGFLLLGAGGYLTYRVSSKALAAVQGIPKLPAMLDGICRAINAQTELLRELSRKLDTVLEQNHSLEAAF
ncbi:hypothetical protein CRENBAI_006089 [Crenichthys baileyi]|uniref:Uncharacterized protein n=1 Tax=Crenichthys baileyi TaxID=28760 RepID=A0AAV9QN45_9TELE